MQGFKILKQKKLIKNLETLSLVELNAQEMQEIEGGAIFKLTGFFAALTGNASWSEVHLEIFGAQVF